jgi:hypothetical protein
MKKDSPEAMPEVHAAVDDFKQKWEETLKKWKEIEALRTGIKDIDWKLGWLQNVLQKAIKYQTWTQQPVKIELDRWDRELSLTTHTTRDCGLHNLYGMLIDKTGEVKRLAESFKQSLDFYPHFEELLETLATIEAQAIKLQGVYLAKTIGSIDKALRSNFFDKLRKYPFGHEYARKRLQETHQAFWRTRPWEMPTQIEDLPEPLGAVSDAYPEDPADYDPVVTPIKPGTPQQTNLPFRSNKAVNQQYAEFNSPYDGKAIFSNTTIDRIVSDNKQFKNEFNYGEGTTL